MNRRASKYTLLTREFEDMKALQMDVTHMEMRAVESILAIYYSRMHGSMQS